MLQRLFSVQLNPPTLWSAEQPNLYEAEIALLNEGALVERTGLKVEMCIRDRCSAGRGG